MEEFGVLYNVCYGGFCFSNEFVDEFEKRTGIHMEYNYSHQEYRDHPEAIKFFEEKGSKWSSGSFSKLDIVYIPIIMKDYYQVGEYDGKEHVGLQINCAIVARTDEYIANPSSEKFEWLKNQIQMIRECRIRYD